MSKMIREICRTVEVALAGWPQTVRLIVIILAGTAAYATITRLT